MNSWRACLLQPTPIRQAKTNWWRHLAKELNKHVGWRQMIYTFADRTNQETLYMLRDNKNNCLAYNYLKSSKAVSFAYKNLIVTKKCRYIEGIKTIPCVLHLYWLIDWLIDVVLRHTLPVFTGLGRCPIVSWDFAEAVIIFEPDALPVVHQWPLPGLEPATSRVRVVAHNH